jgi:hypothetical protein
LGGTVRHACLISLRRQPEQSAAAATLSDAKALW